MEQFEVEEPLNTKKESKQTKNKKSLIKSLSLGLVCIFAIACFYLAITDSALIAHAKDKLGLDKKYPVLIADIGGTNVRLSLLKMSKSIDIAPVTIKKDKLSPKDFKSLDDLFEKYLSSVNEKEYPLYAVIGIPGPVKDNEILHLTNIPHWPKASGDALAKKFGIKKFIFLNDFTCNGYGVQTKLKLGEDYVIINDVKPQPGGGKTIIGPGTGLGMGYLVKEPGNEYFTIGASEGGHQDFTPKEKKYFELREFMINLLKLEGVSVERVLSGQALIPMYKFLLKTEKGIKRDKELGEKVDKFNDFTQSKLANEINIELTQKGISGKCELSKKVLELFVEIFGEVAGDVSLFSLPTDGLYLVGGMSIALESIIKGTNIFMDHFLNKDSFAFLLKTFPVYLVKNGDLGMLGAGECARRLLADEN